MKELVALASNMMLAYKDDDDVFFGCAELVIISRLCGYKLRDDGTMATYNETFQDRILVGGKKLRQMIEGLQKLEVELAAIENRVKIEKSDEPV